VIDWEKNHLAPSAVSSSQLLSSSLSSLSLKGGDHSDGKSWLNLLIQGDD
jgi:hypothetical protein